MAQHAAIALYNSTRRIASVPMSGGTTVGFEGSVDGTIWTPLLATKLGTTTTGTSTTEPGEWVVSVIGLSSLRTPISNYSAGTITVKGYSSVLTGAGAGGSGGASGGGIFQQCMPTTGISAVRMLDSASAAGQTIYNANLLNWSAVQDILDDYWTPNDIAAMDYTINWGEGVVIVHQDGTTPVSNFVGGGFLTYSVFTGIGDSLSGGIAGGMPGEAKSENQTNNGDFPESTNAENDTSGCKCCDPILLFSCSFQEEDTDLTVGSGAYPYSLEFSRHYDSANRLQDGPLGLGWTHNLATSVSASSNGLRAMGEVSPKEAAASIAQAFVLLKLNLGIGYSTFVDLLNAMIGVTSTQWLMDAVLTGNAIVIDDVEVSRTFIKLIDGSYNPPPGLADTLEDNLDGTFTLRSPQKLEWNFNTDGKLETYVDPAGVTVTYSYTDGNLTSVSNGLGRTLTLDYADGRLVSVTDDSERTISFTVSSNGNLIAFTDTESNTTVYDYTPDPLLNPFGQLAKIFRPAFPDIPFVYPSGDYEFEAFQRSGSKPRKLISCPDVSFEITSFK